MPSSLGGFAEGFWSRIDSQRQEEARLELERSRREGEILQLLATHGKPDVQAMALQGLLDSANPKQRKKGLGGFLGQYQPSAAVGQLYSLLQTPERVEQQVNPDDVDAQATPGLPGMANTPVGQTAPLTFQPTPIPQRTEVSYQPRQAVYTPEEQALMQTRGQAAGRIAGVRTELQAAGFTPEEEQQILKGMLVRQYGRGAGGPGAMQARAVELPDGSQTMAVFNPMDGKFYDPDTRQPLADAMPLQKTGSFSMGADRESIAREKYGVAASKLNPQQMADVNQEVIRRGGESAFEKTIARGTAQADVPLSTAQRFQAVTNLQDDWRKAIAPVREMQRQYGLMEQGLNAYKRGDRVGGSQAVLVTFQKVLDPMSVVRESEYARSGSGLALMSRLQGMYEKYIGQYDPATQRWVGGGAGVPEQELAEMVKTAKTLVDNAAPWAEGERQRIEATARDFGLDPARITGTTRTTGGPPPAAGAGGAGGAAAPAGAAPAAPSSSISESELKVIAGQMVPPVSPDVLKAKYLAAGYTITR